jgi:bacteriocin biosynthesis cyclodehydratase domain-containing protein
MGRMVLKLDPRIPLVWRSPSSLQFGVEPPRVILDEVTSAQERIISALVSGISRSGLMMTARSAGADEAVVDALLDQLSPLLHVQSDETEERRAHIVVVGRGATAERIVRIFTDAGQRVTHLSGAGAMAAAAEHTRMTSKSRVEERPHSIAVVVGHFVLEPDLYGYWLRRDIPHLPVIFSDTAVHLGPMIEPGRGPCLYCLERYRSEADSAWPAIASQLWGRKAPTETALLSREIAARVARAVLERVSSGMPLVERDGSTSALRIDARHGTVVNHRVTPHPDCGCIELPTATPPENDSPDGSVRGVHPPQPTTVPTAASHE